MTQIPREVTIVGKSGIEYNGVLKAGIDPVFKNNLCVLSKPNKSLRDIIFEEHGMVTLDSQFKSINIREIADDYMYLGGKEDCKNYIKKNA